LSLALAATLKDWIQTYTGKKFYPLAPTIGLLDIRDQAHALAMCCRYAGHVKRFYSVAEHAVRISMELEERGHSTEIQKWGLIHDNSEAYLGDVTRPVKHRPELAEYRKAEKHLQQLIASWLGLPLVEPEEVKLIDTEILGTEAFQLKQPIHPDWYSTTASGVQLAKPWPNIELGWDPTVAENNYLSRFRYLWGPHAFGL
jgi:uncharacterized protein